LKLSNDGSLALLRTSFTLDIHTMPFAQLVIGPPGSGKSTYCDGMQQFMGAVERKCSVVNLDPANDHTSYEPAVDVRDLVTIDEIMEQESLGPNGGVLYALEELEHNFDWLAEGLKELGGPRSMPDMG
jgi:GTPase SAR1 family protein